MCPQSALSLASSASTSSSSLASLEDAWPRLKERFNKLASEEGAFPLLTQKQREQFAKNYNWEAEGAKEAAVLVLLCSVSGTPSILFTQRTAHLTHHASEISFPGGHFESGVDESLEATALREAQEELLPEEGLLENQVEVLGHATRIPALRGTPVTPVIAALWKPLKEPVTDTFPGDPSEVDLTFCVSMKDLIEKETTHDLPQNRFGLKRAPLFPSPHGDIWGLTAFILRPLLHKLLRPAFDTSRC